MSTTSYLENGEKFHWGPKVAKLNPEKAQLLKKFVTGKCLDVGFGSGIYTKYVSDLGYPIIGVDYELDFVKYARDKYKKIKFLKSSIETLPFKPKQFDTTIAFDILEHVDDQKALKEVFRVSKRIIFSVPPQNPQILEAYGLSYAQYLDKTHLRAYNLKHIQSLAKKNDYKIIYLQNSLPISLSGLLIKRLARGSILLELILKTILKPFLPEPPLFSTIFGVLESNSL